ncbi:hypothetical protein ABPG74_016010 [Tetrahymena malaccensis]
MEKQIKKSQSFVIKNSAPLLKNKQKELINADSIFQDRLKKVSFSEDQRQFFRKINQNSSVKVSKQDTVLPKLKQLQILTVKKPFTFSELSKNPTTTKQNEDNYHCQFGITVQELQNIKEIKSNQKQQIEQLTSRQMSKIEPNLQDQQVKIVLNQQKEALKVLKEIFPQLTQLIMSLFLEKLETTVVYKDKKKILLSERLINYGASKSNTTFHLRKYLDICLDIFQFEDQFSNDETNKQIQKRLRSNLQNQQQQENKQINILYQIPRQVSELFLECIKYVINQNEILSQKNFLFSVFARNIHLIQPTTPLQEICSTESLLKIIEYIYDELSNEPYLNSLMPKKTPYTLRLANQLSDILLTKNYKMIPPIIKKFKQSAVFTDPKHNILLRAELLEQLDKEIQDVKQMVQLQLHDQEANSHYFEKVTSTDFYLAKSLIRKSLENKAKLSSDEVNLFIETVEEARFITMNHLYKEYFKEENILNLVKLMTSKIISLGSDFLNQFFEQKSLSIIIKQFSQQVVSYFMIQPDLQKLKWLFTIQKGEKISQNKLQKVDSIYTIQAYNEIKYNFDKNEQQFLSKLNSQFYFLNTIQEIVLISLKQLDYKLIFQRNIELKFNKIGWSFLPQNFDTQLIEQIKIQQIPSQFNLSNIQAILNKIQVSLTKKYIHFPDVQIIPLCEIGREFLLNFSSERNTYSTEDLISSFKYYDIKFSQSKYLIEALEFALTSMNLWSESIKMHILEEIILQNSFKQEYRNIFLQSVRPQQNRFAFNQSIYFKQKLYFSSKYDKFTDQKIEDIDANRAHQIEQEEIQRKFIMEQIEQKKKFDELFDIFVEKKKDESRIVRLYKYYRKRYKNQVLNFQTFFLLNVVLIIAILILPSKEFNVQKAFQMSFVNNISDFLFYLQKTGSQESESKNNKQQGLISPSKYIHFVFLTFKYMQRNDIFDLDYFIKVMHNISLLIYQQTQIEKNQVGNQNATSISNEKESTHMIMGSLMNFSQIIKECVQIRPQIFLEKDFQEVLTDYLEILSINSVQLAQVRRNFLQEKQNLLNQDLYQYFIENQLNINQIVGVLLLYNKKDKIMIYDSMDRIVINNLDFNEYLLHFLENFRIQLYKDIANLEGEQAKIISQKSFKLAKLLFQNKECQKKLIQDKLLSNLIKLFVVKNKNMHIEDIKQIIQEISQNRELIIQKESTKYLPEFQELQNLNKTSNKSVQEILKPLFK